MQKTSPPPLTGYGFSKVIGEYICKKYFEEFSIPYVIGRPFNVYGEGEVPEKEPGYSHVIPDMIEKILSGQYPLEILGDGSQTRSFTHVKDVASAFIFLAEHGENDHFNIGTGREINIIKLAEMLWEFCGKKEPIKFRYLPPVKYDVKRRVPDISKIKKLGWKPEISLEDGLKNMVKYFRKIEE